MSTSLPSYGIGNLHKKFKPHGKSRSLGINCTEVPEGSPIKYIISSEEIPFHQLRPDGKDLVLLDKYGKILPYWIELKNSTIMHLWLKFPYEIKSFAPIYAYYNNLQDAKVSHPSAAFKYKRKIIISEQSGNNLADYQVLIELSSSNFDFSKTKTNGEDIRFTDANGSLLDYWIEEWDVVNEIGKIWVKIPSIPANSSIEIWMYYGNPDITSASNASAVFEFFNDFEYGGELSLGTSGFQKPFSHFTVDIQQTGLLPSNYTSDITNPIIAWSYSCGKVGKCVLVDDVNGDGKGEVIFATDDDIRCLDWQGNLLWTFSLPSSEWPHTFLIIDDINNDGTKEIVFGTVITHEVDGYVRCLNASNGEEIWSYYCNKGNTTTGSDPNGIQVADIDGDGEKEVLVLLDLDGELLVLNADGTLKYSKTEVSELEYGIAVGDIDNDGELEYVHGTEADGIQIRRASDGTIKASWSGASNTYYSASPSIADIDGDGKMEILAGMDVLASGGTSLVCLEDDATVKWSVTNKGDMDAAPGLLADVDGDGNYEFVKGSGDHNIYCFDALTGEIKWTYATNDKCQYAPVLGADIDGDGNLEIIVLNRVDGNIYCLDNAGNLKWEISVGAGGTHRSLAIADLNNDGKVELIVPTTNGVACYINGAPSQSGFVTDDAGYHGKAIKQYDTDGGWTSAKVEDFTEAPASSEVVEFWFKRATSGDSANFGLSDAVEPSKYWPIRLRYRSDGILDAFDGTDTISLGTVTDGEWYRCKINIDNANQKWNVWIYKKDGSLLGSATNIDYQAAGTPQKLLANYDDRDDEYGIWFDLLRKRKFAEPEPSVNLGEEESV